MPPVRNVFFLPVDSLRQSSFSDTAREIAATVDGVRFTEAITTASDTDSAMPVLAAGQYPQSGSTGG